jgi:hypothetical protein
MKQLRIVCPVVEIDVRTAVDQLHAVERRVKATDRPLPEALEMLPFVPKVRDSRTGLMVDPLRPGTARRARMATTDRGEMSLSHRLHHALRKLAN